MYCPRHSASARGEGFRLSTQPTDQNDLARLLALSVDAIVAADADHLIVAFNRGAETIFGYAANEVLGAPLSMLLPERFRKQHEDHLRRFATAGESSQMMGDRREIWGRRKTGEEFPAEASIAVAISDAESGPQFSVVLREISERRALEEAVRSSEQRLRRALDGAADAADILDHRGRYVYANDASRALQGRELAEILGHHSSEFVDLSWAEVAEPVEEGSRTYRTRLKRKDGAQVPVEIRVTNLGDGTHLALTRDMTNWVRTENALRASETRLARVQQIAQLGSIEWVPATETMIWSPELWAILGLESTEHSASVRLYKTLVHPDDRAKRLEDQTRDLAAGAPQPGGGTGSCGRTEPYVWWRTHLRWSMRRRER